MKTSQVENEKALFRLASEMGPLILFFIAAKWQGIYWATAVFMVATVLAASLAWRKEGRIPVLPVGSTVVALLFGGLTLLWEDPVFIKIRPTVLNLLAALILGATLLRGRLVLKSIFGGSIAIPDTAWRTLSLRVVAFLLFLAALNEGMWRALPTEDWVTFKAFGVPPLNLLFLAANWPFLRRQRERMAEAGGRPLACPVAKPA